ncbi:MAG: undecaprenyldiphospho-muramoylpentapeptide beta-N-acetylglucosaminyltransferase [Proteobacteria bacterium]|nr:undecaprenyldiphospho-muramoylpentapeptide beta-N-acetylglucosaminyltransferase [Pseudomonadota bacterium]MBU1738973.1 undecaprenyldiphospho-muramoylpentapeptide beta-N-acetylglucosaminyltransferase [Pseudomonadota bacterium]
MAAPAEVNNFRLVITGGGTGGHLFPGIAVADQVLENMPQSKVLFIGTDRQVDAKVLVNRPFAIATVKCQGLKGKSPRAILSSLIQLPMALVASMRILRKFRPHLVLGVGGYVTGPVVLAARILGIPTTIHEQNSVPGLANRLLGKIVDRVFLSIPGSEKFFPPGKVLLTGNPLRKAILAAGALRKKNPGTALLVMGGSQGAHRINILVAEGLQKVHDTLPADFFVIHQTGRADVEEIRKIYERAGIRARVEAFIDDMAAVYVQAGLVVSRAGATSLAEICAMGLPSILIPFPSAADNHQEYNARMVSERGGAVLLKEEGLDAEVMAATISGMLQDSEELLRIGEKAGSAAFPEATEKIVWECLKLAGFNQGAALKNV